MEQYLVRRYPFPCIILNLLSRYYNLIPVLLRKFIFSIKEDSWGFYSSLQFILLFDKSEVLLEDNFESSDYSSHLNEPYVLPPSCTIPWFLERFLFGVSISLNR